MVVNVTHCLNSVQNLKKKKKGGGKGIRGKASISHPTILSNYIGLYRSTDTNSKIVNSLRRNM